MGRSALSNLGTLALALLLGVLVWVVAISEEDPIEEKTLPDPVPVEVLNLPHGTIIVGDIATATNVTLRAPRSVWEALTAAKIHATVDLSGLAPGAHKVKVEWRSDESAAWVTKLNPATMLVTLESRATRDLPMRIQLSGEPALGYEAGAAKAAVTTATIIGPASLVDSVSETVAAVSLLGLKSDFDEDVALLPVDPNGNEVRGVTVEPAAARVFLPITHKLGFRDVAVKVVIAGQVASGYRITNITVAPPVVTLASTDPNQVAELPGFVETEPIDIAEASDDLAVRVALALPKDISLVGEQSVLVQVSIAAIESGLTVQRPLELQGLGPGLAATASPATVDVILSGPLPVLDTLKQEDVRVILDLTGLGVGTHQVAPQAILLPEKLRAENVLPSQIEVTVTSTATPTKKP